MPASTFTKFHATVANIANGKHNLAADQLSWALTNALNPPTAAAANAALSTLTQIAYTNCSSRNPSTTSSTQTSGAYSLIVADLTLTASGGAIAPFRYAILYNTVATGFEMLGWLDYGADVTINDTESLLLDLPATALLSSAY